MRVDWPGELIEQLDWHWNNHLRPRWHGLTDDEYLWEPVVGCWSVRPRGDGTFSVDYAYPEPDPPPFTTIAWRLCHIGSGVLRSRVSNHFGDGSYDSTQVDWPGTAADGLAWVEEAYGAWRSALQAAGEERFLQPCGPSEGPYADHPFASLVAHINREVIHHGAEVCCLRDLYRATAASGPLRTPPPSPAG